MALQRVLINPFITRPEHEQFILLVGLAIIMVNGLLMIFGPDARHANLSYSFDSWLVPTGFSAEIIVDKVRVYAAVAALVVCGLLFAFFRFTPDRDRHPGLRRQPRRRGGGGARREAALRAHIRRSGSPASARRVR